MQATSDKRTDLETQSFDWVSWRRNSLPSQKWNLLYLLIAGVVYQFWPVSIESCATLRWDWVISVILRNFAIMTPFYIAAHHHLYVARSQGDTTKFNKEWPSEEQHRRDRRLTLLSLLIGSLFEVWYMWCLANNAVPWYSNLLEHPVLTAVGILSVPVVRALHFYCAHRVLHPWFSRRSTDPGWFLYRHVHSVHHRSHNPGPWSGLAMHPVESTLLYTTMLPHMLFKTHPLIWLFNKVHCDLSPIPGHHGFECPMGQKFHFLHHKYFECNYGGSLLPLDAVFGTYRKS